MDRKSTENADAEAEELHESTVCFVDDRIADEESQSESDYENNDGNSGDPADAGSEEEQA